MESSIVNKKVIVNGNESSIYELNGKPRFIKAFPLALQHVMAMLVGNITPPILIAQLLGLPESDRILLMQAAMLIGGITTLMQLYAFYGFGMGLPNVMGGLPLHICLFYQQ